MIRSSVSTKSVSSPVACTIVANNYLAYARVVAESFLRQHPDGTFHVLLVDRRLPEIDYLREPFVCWFAEDLGIPEFRHLAFRYSILELSTAVKPWFLRHLHRQTGCPAAAYFDPDILITGRLDEIYTHLGDADVVMTPHVSMPIEDDGIPGERDFLLSGIYNLGFLGIAFNERTLPFLDWWHRRLYRECLHAVERGLFVDQRWMDFAPAFLDRVEVLREPGWNVAYWSLVHHRFERCDAEWRVDGRPLRFYHFSGYDHERPREISHFQNRFTLDDRPDVAPLFTEYGERLERAGHALQQHVPYGYGTFDNGVAVPAIARALLRDVDPESRRWHDPFLTAGDDSFYSWITHADGGGSDPFIPRIAVAVWESRVDLRQVFPAPRGPSRLGFARWLVGNIDHGLAEELLERVKASLPPADTSIATVEQTKRQVKDLLVLHGGVPSEAFSRDEMALLVTEASGIEGGSPLFCLLGLILHQLRGDLRMSFPDPAGVNRARFALWYVTSGWSEFDLPWALVAPVWRSLDWRSAVWAAWRARFWVRSSSAREQQRRTLREHFARAAAAPIEPERPQPASLPDGVNVIGWTNAATGVGEACRGSLAALAEARVVHAVWSLVEPGTPESLGHGAGSAGQPGAPYEVDLLHVNADMMRVITEALPSWVTAGRHRVGYWFWELSHFPLGFAPAFDLVDEVWAPTRFCLDAFAPLASVPVRWVPPSVPRQPVAAMARHDWGVPEDSFLFLCAFDARSVPERKNPNGVLHAFALAVEAWRASAANRKPLHLLLKVNHGEEAPELLRELEGRAAGLPVTFSSATVPRQTIDSLIGGCDALLSLHRSEGLGLSLIEAMQLGRPVIATGYGGCSDFLDDETGWVVRHSLVPLRQAYGPYPAGAVWAEPDLGHAAELMVQVAGDAEGRERRAAAARRRVDEIYSPAAAGERFKREFDRILAARRGRAT